MATVHTNDAMLAVLKAKYGTTTIADGLAAYRAGGHSAHTRTGGREANELDAALTLIGSSQAKITVADKANKFWSLVVAGQL